MPQANKLNALYYPFSRTTNLSSIKQFMLLYDQTTFLDPVSDEEWRAHLFSNLTDVHGGFDSYTDLADNFPLLIAEGAVKVVDPDTIISRDSKLTTAAIVSDLADENWVNLSNPQQAGIPYELDQQTGRPLWQMFKAKIPDRFLEAAYESPFLNDHLLKSGGERYSWHLSYSAGSAIAVNVHMAAAEELGLQLVSDSTLHNRLLLAKAERRPKAITSVATTLDHTEHVANGTMMTVFNKLMPAEVLSLISVEEILLFREKTAGLRTDFSDEIRSLVLRHEALHENRQSHIPEDLAAQLAGDVKRYGDELEAVKDTIWPRLIGSVSAVGTVRTSGAGYAASYISGSGYLMAASLLLHALSPLKTLMEIHADIKKVRRSPSSAVAFLVKSQELGKR